MDNPPPPLPPPFAQLVVAQGAGSTTLPARLAVRCLASSPGASPQPAAPKAALLVIGDEVLHGSITDANTPWLAKLLFSRGVDLVRVEVVPDDAADIGSTALRLKQRVGEGGFVFTSGGIGPTHDDVTYEALAEAFGERASRGCH